MALVVGNLIAAPLLRLAAAARRIRRFDFASAVDTGSRITEVHDLAASALQGLGLDIDAIVEDRVAPYPVQHGGRVTLAELSAGEGWRLLRLNAGQRRGAIGELEVLVGCIQRSDVDPARKPDIARQQVVQRAQVAHALDLHLLPGFEQYPVAVYEVRKYQPGKSHRGHEHEAEDGDEPDELRADAGVRIGQDHGDQPPHARDTVHRYSAYRVVDAQAIQCRNGEHDDDAAEGADAGGEQRGGRQRLGRDGYEAGQGAVQRHCQIGLAELEVRREKCAD